MYILFLFTFIVHQSVSYQTKNFTNDPKSNKMIPFSS